MKSWYLRGVFDSAGCADDIQRLLLYERVSVPPPCLRGELRFESIHHRDTENTEDAQRESEIRRACKQLPQHIWQNPAVLVVVDLDRGVDAQRHRHILDCAVRAMNHKHDFLSRLDFALQADEIKRLRAFEIQRRSTDAFFELARQDSHSHKIASMYTLEALCYDGLDPKQHRALRGPVSRASRSIFLAGDNNQGHSFRLILHCGVIDAHSLTIGLMHGDPAFSSRHHQILDAHVGKCAAHHHLIVSAPRAVTVEIRDAHAFLLQVNPGRRRRFDSARRAYVIGRYRIPEDRQRSRALN